MERINAFNSYLPMTAAWSLNLQAGTFTIGDKTVRMQVIGTYSEQHAAWVWAWANASLQGYPDVIAEAQQLRAFGEERNIAEFADRAVDLSAFENRRFGAEKLAFVATALLGATGYVGVTTGAFQTFLTSDDRTIPDHGPRDPQRVGTYLRAAAEWFPNAEPMDLAIAYAETVGGRFQPVPGGLVVNLGEGSMTLHYGAGGVLDRVGPPLMPI